MIRLKIGRQAPVQAAILANVRSPGLNPVDHVSLADLSSEVPENIVGAPGQVLQVPLTAPGNLIPSTDVEVGFRSRLDIQAVTPRYLFYRHRVGKNTGVPGFTARSVYHESNTADLEEARYEIRRFFKILDVFGEPETGVEWDIVVTDKSGTKKYEVDLLLSDPGDQERYFQISYNAVDALGNVTNGFRELVNARPHLTRRRALEKTATEYTSEAGIGTEYGVKVDLATGFRSIFPGTVSLTGFGPPGTGPYPLNASFSDCLGLFYLGSGEGKYDVDERTIYLYDPVAADSTLSVVYSGKAVDAVVRELNALGSDYRVVPMNDSPLLDDEDLGKGTLVVNAAYWVSGGIPVRRFGTRIIRWDHLNIRLSFSVAVYPKKPFRELTALESWYPRISDGLFVDEDSIYFVSELEDQIMLTSSTVLDGSPIFGTPTHWNTGEQPRFRDIHREAPNIIDDRTIQVRYPWIAPESVKFFVNNVDRTDLINDYSIAGGVLRLSEVPVGSLLSIRYAYQILDFVYTGVDLNPTALHNPDIYNKLVGIYMVPATFTRSDTGFPTHQETTVHHVVMDSLDDILSAVTALQIAPGTSYKAILLGVFHVVRTFDAAEIEILDLRIPGGGIRLDQLMLVAGNPKALYFSDIGRYDGLPYPRSGSLIVRYPKRVRTEDDAVQPNEFPTTDFNMLPSKLQDNIDDPTLALERFGNPDGVQDEISVRQKIRRHAPVGTLHFPEMTE